MWEVGIKAERLKKQKEIYAEMYFMQINIVNNVCCIYYKDFNLIFEESTCLKCNA